MTEKILENKLVELINQVQDGVGEAILFGQEHIPDVIQQVLWWHGVRGFLYHLLLLGILYGTYRLFKHKSFMEWLKFDEFNVFIFSVCYFFPVLVISIILLGCGLSWIQILVAPKLYLIEYAACLLK